MSRACEGYQLQDIFNANETGLYYRALILPSHSMEMRLKEERTDHSFAGVFCYLWNSAKPHCFKKLPSVLCFLVTYASKKKAWMTNEIIKQWVEKINNKMIT